MVVSCWMEDHPYINYIYKIPCICSVVINILFLVVIVIKLVTMLHSDVSDRSATIKTTKAIGNYKSNTYDFHFNRENIDFIFSDKPLYNIVAATQ